MVVRQALVPIAAGVVIGGGVALALGSVLQSLLFEISSRDPVTLAAIAAGLAVVGIVASVVPALRATRVDPLVALRSE